MELNQCINYLLTTAQHKIFQELSGRLAVYDITPVQYGVLNCLWRGQVLSPKEIAEQLMIENSTISGVLERMEKKMLISRNISTEDRRFVQVELTERGKKLESPVLGEVERFNREVYGAISKEEEEALKALLKKLAAMEFSRNE